MSNNSELNNAFFKEILAIHEMVTRIVSSIEDTGKQIDMLWAGLGLCSQNFSRLDKEFESLNKKMEEIRNNLSIGGYEDCPTPDKSQG